MWLELLLAIINFYLSFPGLGSRVSSNFLIHHVKYTRIFYEIFRVVRLAVSATND